MPTTYTHDLFGKKVYQGLPQEMRQLLRTHRDLYRIGLHGPDIFFYHLFYRKMYQYGIGMHHKKAAPFFEKAMEQVRTKRDPALLAYLLGFGCHYLLDTICHPYINEMAEQGQISHTLLEKELDRTLMVETGKNPLEYRPSDGIVLKQTYAETIQEVFPCFSPKSILFSLWMMKDLTNAMVCDDGGKRRKSVQRLTGILGKKKQKVITDYLMTPEPVKRSRQFVAHTQELYREALEKAPQYLEELYQLSLGKAPLSQIWNHTFTG